MKMATFRSWNIFSTAIILFLISVSVFFYRSYFRSDFIRINSITEVLKYTRNVDLVIFDIDLTLMMPIAKDKSTVIDYDTYSAAMTSYSTDVAFVQYGSRIIQALRQAGVTASDSSIKNAIAYYIKYVVIRRRPNLWGLYIVPNTMLTPVEPETIAVIEKLKAQHIPILLYTARDWTERSTMEKEFQQSGIVFDRNGVYTKRLVVAPTRNEQCGFGFENGILYWFRNEAYSNQHDASKGPILLEFLNAINMHPKKILFIDDTKKRIERIRPLLHAHGIDAIALWYRGIEKTLKPTDTLNPAVLRGLNTYLPQGWQYVPVNFQETVDFLCEFFEKKMVPGFNLAHA